MVGLAANALGHAHRHAHHIIARATATESSSATSTSDAPTNTIAPYATELNGVNQPLNNIFKEGIWWSLGGLAMLILLIRLWHRASMHLRHMVSMNMSAEAPSHNQFRNHKTDFWWKFKKYVLYAPLGKMRHNTNIKFGNMEIGCMPTKFHTLLVFAFFMSNVAFCCALDFSAVNKYAVVAELRGRTGVLAIINMVALVLLAGRNNPLIAVLQISFDTYNLLHRWIGRVVVIESLLHTWAWAYVKYADLGWTGVFEQLKTDAFAYWGLVSVVTMTFILILSLSPIRHAFYETFLDIHIILAAASMLGIYLHCYIADLPQLPYVKAILILWGLDRAARMFRLLWDNYSLKHGKTQAFVLALPGDACRVTMKLPTKMHIVPGSHAYLRFSHGFQLKFWESHPFSIAWVEHKHTIPQLPTTEMNDNEVLKKEEGDMVTEVSFVIGKQNGMTRRLYEEALLYREQGMVLTAWMEGPYGGHHSLDSYGHVVLFAGATGITHQIPFVRHLVQGCHARTIATRKITLVWIVRDSEMFEWVRPWMEQILKLEGRRECLNIKLFVTRPKNSKLVVSPSKTVQIMSGRPKVGVLLEEEVRHQRGAMAVTVCGPGPLQDSVRLSVRENQEHGVIDYVEESFTW